MLEIKTENGNKVNKKIIYQNLKKLKISKETFALNSEGLFHWRMLHAQTKCYSTLFSDFYTVTIGFHTQFRTKYKKAKPTTPTAAANECAHD